MKNHHLRSYFHFELILKTNYIRIAFALSSTEPYMKQSGKSKTRGPADEGTWVWLVEDICTEALDVQPLARLPGRLRKPSDRSTHRSVSGKEGVEDWAWSGAWPAIILHTHTTVCVWKSQGKAGVYPVPSHTARMGQWRDKSKTVGGVRQVTPQLGCHYCERRISDSE